MNLGGDAEVLPGLPCHIQATVFDFGAISIARFFLPTWQTAISRKLDIVGNFYQLLTDRVRTAQSQTLELIIIALILAEIVLAFFTLTHHCGVLARDLYG